jgi:hypothetical protein
MMAVAGVFREGGAVAGAQDGFAAVLDQGQFAFQDVDEFVLVRVPVALAGPVSGRQAGQVDAEILDPAGGAQALADPVLVASAKGGG